MLESKAYQTYYAFASGEKAPKPKYIRKKVDSDTSPKKKPVQATKGTTLKTLAKVAKSDKKKQPAKMPKAKGLNVLYEVALTEAEQMKLATKRSKTQFHNSHASGSEVLDVPKYDSESEEEYWTFSQDDEDAEEESDMNDDSDETESDNNGDDLTHPNLSTFKADKEGEEEEKADDEEVSSDQRVSTPPDYELTEEEEYKEDDDKDKEGEHEEEEDDDLYRDLNINLERSDAEMTDAQANQDTEDTHVTLTTVPPVVQQQSSSVSSDLVSKVSALESEMSEFRQTSQFAKAVSSIPGITSYALAASLSEFELNKILVDKIETNKSIDKSDTPKNLYNALVESYNTNKDIITSYGDVVTLKRGRDDHDKDEDPSAGSNRGSKGRKSGKEAESSKDPKNKESKSTKIMIKKAADLEDQPHQEFKTGYEDESLAREALNEDVWHRNPSRPPTPYPTNDRLDWNNPERKPYPHDLSKPLPLILNEHGHQVIPLDHFINNDLEYLKGGSSSQKYTTSITKTKADDYGQVKWIEDKKFYRYASNMETSKDVYSRHKIIAVTSLKIMKWFGYSHLEEIIVRR
ncbi:hypothetical protein Tco_0706908 [Tanacetum coccineum]|uniref:Uncharacterized protein n=1 Tax=Tanacetum coccineum TaxID=301880 RepID=A0ABQ4YAY9_9ASTR